MLLYIYPIVPYALALVAQLLLYNSYVYKKNNSIILCSTVTVSLNKCILSNDLHFQGGLGLSNTCYARVVEAICSDPAISTTLMAHQSIGLKVSNHQQTFYEGSTLFL